MIIIKSVEKIKIREIVPTDRQFKGFASHEILLSKASLMGSRLEQWSYKYPPEKKTVTVTEKVPVRRSVVDVPKNKQKDHDEGVRAIMAKYSFLGDYDKPRMKEVTRRKTVAVPKRERIPQVTHTASLGRKYKKDLEAFLITFTAPQGALNEAGHARQAILIDGVLYYLARPRDVTLKFAREHNISRDAILGRKTKQKLSLFVNKTKRVTDRNKLKEAANECVSARSKEPVEIIT